MHLLLSKYVLYIYITMFLLVYSGVECQGQGGGRAQVAFGVRGEGCAPPVQGHAKSYQESRMEREARHRGLCRWSVLGVGEWSARRCGFDLWLVSAWLLIFGIGIMQVLIQSVSLYIYMCVYIHILLGVRYARVRFQCRLCFSQSLFRCFC